MADFEISTDRLHHQHVRDDDALKAAAEKEKRREIIQKEELANMEALVAGATAVPEEPQATDEPSATGRVGSAQAPEPKVPHARQPEAEAGDAPTVPPEYVEHSRRCERVGIGRL